MTGFLKKQGKTLEEGLVLFFRTWGEAGGGESGGVHQVSSGLAGEGYIKVDLNIQLPVSQRITVTPLHRTKGCDVSTPRRVPSLQRWLQTR